LSRYRCKHAVFPAFLSQSFVRKRPPAGFFRCGDRGQKLFFNLQQMRSASQAGESKRRAIIDRDDSRRRRLTAAMSMDFGCAGKPKLRAGARRPRQAIRRISRRGW